MAHATRVTDFRTPIPRARVARGIRRVRDAALITAAALTVAYLGAVVVTYW